MSPHVVYSTLDVGIMIARYSIFFMYINIIQCIGFEANWFCKQALSQSDPLQFNTTSFLIRLPHGPHWPFFSWCTNQPWIIILQIQQDVMQENSKNYRLSFAWFLWFFPLLPKVKDFGTGFNISDFSSYSSFSSKRVRLKTLNWLTKELVPFNCWRQSWVW
jgi:hypothetical protein